MDQTFADDIKGRRSHKYKHCLLRQTLFDFQCAHDLHIHHNVNAVGDGFSNRGERRAVIVSDILGVFQQRVVGNESFKALARDKIVALTVDLAGANRAGGRRYRIPHVLAPVNDGVQKRIFPDAGRAGHHEQFSLHAPCSSGSGFSSIRADKISGETDARMT